MRSAGAGAERTRGSEHGDAPSAPPARILVVEDEQIVALELKDRLRAMGHSVAAVVGSGEEAIEYAKKLRPDLLLMDIKLQGEIDGIQAADAIHDDVDVPVVYLTAFADAPTLARAKLTEPYGYVLKPFQERELQVVIEVALYRHRMQRHQHFMASTSGEVASSLEREMIVQKVSTMIAHDLADWCVIHLREKDTTLRLAAFAHRDARKSVLTGAFSGAGLAGPEAVEIQRVAESGRSLLISEPTDGDGAGTLLKLARSLAPARTVASAIIVPLIIRGDVLGTLTVVSEDAERPLTALDLAFVEELGRRMATGIDNARLYAEAQLAVRMREEILAVVSHDLKNPLMSIIMSADQLLRSPDQNTPERVARNALKIRSSAERMARLANDLLDVARIDSGRLSLEIQRVSARELVGEALAMFDAAASDHSICLSSAALPDVDLFCDRERLLQVFSNLIGNALKFSRDGRSITVEGRPSGPSLIFSVSDEAGGIPDEERGHVFERFWQGPEALRKGTGLGLYIAKGLVEAQGGHIWFDSTPGAGTTFYFTVPLAEAVEEWAPSP